MLDSESKKRLIEKARVARTQKKTASGLERIGSRSLAEQGEAQARREIEFAMAQEFAATGSFTVDLNTGEQDWSDQVFRILGLAPGTVPATFDVYLDHVHPEDRPLLVQKSNPTFMGKKDLDHQYRVVRPNGQIRFVHTKANVVREPGKEEARIHGFTQDITERKQAEEELRSGEHKYRTLVEANPHGIQKIDTSGVITFTNPAYERMLGYSAKELLGKSILDLIEPRSRRDELRDHLVTLVREQPEPTTYLQNNRAGDGRIIDMEVDWTYDRDDEGQVTGFTSVITDVTERKQAEERQRFATRVLALLNQPGKTVDMIHAILLAVREFTGLEAVGIRLRRGDDFPYYETSGFSADFVEAENQLCVRQGDEQPERNSDGRLHLQCMCGNVICGRTDPSLPFFTEGGSFWTNSTTALLASSEKQLQGPIRNRCNSSGYESVALIPLHADGETIGLLQLNDSRNDMFTPEMISFIEGIGTSIGISCRSKRVEEQLRQSRDYLEQILNGMREGVMVVDRAYGITDANRSLLEQHKTTRDLIIGRKCYDVCHRQNAPCPGLKDQCPVGAVIRTGRHTRVEHNHTDDVGGEHTVDVHAFPLFAEDGTVERVVYLSHDITERKRAAEALAASEHRYRTAIDSMSDAIYVVDADLRILLINDRFKRWMSELKLETAEPVGRTVFEVFPFLPANVGEEYRQVFDSASALTTEDRTFIGGKELITETRKIPICDAGRAIRVVTVVRDITEQKRAEVALQESEERFKLLFERAPDGIYLNDLNSVLVDVNEAASELVGYTRDELIGKNFAEIGLLSEEDTAKAIARLQKTAAGERLGPEEFTLNRSDGGKVAVEISTFPVTMKGEIFSLGVARDVTDRKKIEVALRQSEHKLRSVIDHSRELFYIRDTRHRLTYVSGRSEEFLGYSPEEMMVNWTSLTTDAPINARGLELSERAIATGEEQEPYPLELKRKDGKTISVEVDESPIKDENGNVIAITGALTDITERRRAEEALRASEERHRSMIELAPDIIVVLNRLGVILSCNSAVEKVTNFARDEIVGKHFSKLSALRLKDVPKYVKVFARILTGEVPEPFDVDFMKKDGSGATVEVRVCPLKDGNIQAIATDVTDRKKAVEALRQSESKFRKIFETAANLITSVDNKGIIVDCNSRIKEVLGYEKGEIVGQSMAKIIHPDYIDSANHALAEILSKGYSRNKEYKMVRKNGTLIDVNVNSSALRDESGKYARTLCIIDDITERKRAGQKLVEYSQQLKSLASQLSLTEERERHRLATMLHDHIGQSLVFSKLKLDQIRQSVSSRDLVEDMDEVCGWIGNVIADTRTLTFDLSSPILYELGFEAAVAEWLSDEIERKHGIETRFEDDKQPKPLDDDIRTVLFRNVRELLTNVAKHAYAHNVKVSLSRVEDSIRIAVEDDGIGFDPVEVTSMAAKRAEFGLFSIRERLSQLGGSIEINSEPGRGARILMTAPLRRTRFGAGPKRA